MNLQFKFSATGIIAFLVMYGLFYWLCPLPSSALWRGIVCAVVALAIFGACFVVVTHKSIIRKK